MKKTMQAALMTTLVVNVVTVASADPTPHQAVPPAAGGAGAAMNVAGPPTPSGVVGLISGATGQKLAPDAANRLASYLDQDGLSHPASFRLSGLISSASAVGPRELGDGVAPINSFLSLAEKVGVNSGLTPLFGREAKPTGNPTNAGTQDILTQSLQSRVDAAEYLDMANGGGWRALASQGVRLNFGQSRLTVSRSQLSLNRNGRFAVAVGMPGAKDGIYGNGKLPTSASLMVNPSSSPFFVSVGVERQGTNSGHGVSAKIGFSVGGAGPSR